MNHLKKHTIQLILLIVISLTANVKLQASSGMTGPVRISGIHAIGLGFSGLLNTTYEDYQGSGTVTANYTNASYSLFSYHATLGVGYDFYAKDSFFYGKAGLGFVIFFLDAGIQQYYYSEATGLFAGISMDQIWTKHNILGQLYLHRYWQVSGEDAYHNWQLGFVIQKII